MDSLDLGFIYTYIGGFSVTGLLHLLGLCLLLRAKDGLENQRIITINLAVTEMLNSFYQVVVSVKLLTGLDRKWLYADMFLAGTLFTMNRMVMLHLILDRCLDIYLNLKYSFYFTKSRLKWISVSLWIFSGSIALTLALVVYSGVDFAKIELIIGYTFFAMDILITLCGILTYIYLFSKISQITECERRTSVTANNQRVKITQARFTIPCLMVATYICFNFTAAIMIMTADMLIGKMGLVKVLPIFEIAHVLILLGLFSDCVVYIFLQRSIRSQLLSMVMPLKERGLSTVSRQTIATHYKEQVQ